MDNMTLIPLLADTTLKNSLAAFVERAFRYLNPNSRYDPAPHILAICHQMDRVLAREEQKLLLTAPPRHLACPRF